uniref:PE domain-containing protein n=1 Tax=Mycobacterium riyadhense TaxID=486698 RepID=A0A653EZE7_9MYCO|nr:hypothetical protein BIN_B_04455 [Mycobacterium riyadhense]
MFVDAPIVAGQGAAEAAGGAMTAATLAGVSPAIATPVPMGGEEVSVLLAQASAAHAAQFLAATAVGVSQRELFAATATTSAAAYTAMNALSQASLAL